MWLISSFVILNVVNVPFKKEFILFLILIILKGTHFIETDRNWSKTKLQKSSTKMDSDSLPLIDNFITMEQE